MNDTDKRDLVNKYGGWERLVIFCGVIMTVPIFALLGTAFYAISHEREGAVMGVVISIIAVLVLWALVWGALWIISGFRSGALVPPTPTQSVLNELREENAHLRQQLNELSKRGDDSS